MRLGELRTIAVMEAVRNSGAASVVDLGCGDGKLLEQLLKEPSLTNVAGIEVSQMALGKAARRLRMRSMTPEQKNRISLVHGSLTYRDQRIAGFDAGVAMEVVEHIDQPKLEAFEDAVFGAARPGTVIVTTPNVEYNAVYFPDEEGRLRHRDHRFEWTRQEFQQWAGAVAGRRQYSVEFQGIGETHEQHGEPTQMAVFRQETQESQRSQAS
jgi:3' terminal RNA ribose 2'-O-methyltransferase Hen1